MDMKKIKITESDLYNIIKQVLLEQEEEDENVWNTDAEEFNFRLFKAFGGDYEKFAKYHNKFYDKIVVDGSLDFAGRNQITILPDNLSVVGNLDLRLTPIISLGDNLFVRGNLDLYHCKNLASLPDNLKVGGELNLYKCENLIFLPDNLRVGNDLDLYGCKNLTSLGDNLSVKGDLDLRGTSIESLPDYLVVKGTVYIYKTPLNDNDELVNKYKEAGYKFGTY